MPTYGELFAGIGGMSLGLERAGWTPRWFVEINPFCRAVLAKHWPNVTCYEDVRALTGGEFERVDLIAGGFPCQPVSSAGKHRAQSDPRWLWPEFARLIRVLRPRVVCLENVPGLLSVNRGRAMGEILGDLAACGYDAEWDGLPAAALGAPHLRWRIFIVAYARGLESRVQPIGKPRRSDQAQHRDDGAHGHMADANSGRLEVCAQLDSQASANSTNGNPCGKHADGCHHALANADGGGRQASIARRGDRVPIFATPENRTALAVSRDRAIRDWWGIEPDVGRVAHGIPRRVDRLRGLGNAVVPQVAEWLGRRLMTAFLESGREPPATGAREGREA